MILKIFADILKEVSEELDEDKDIVSFVVLSQFKFIILKMKENLSTEEDPIISMNYFGKFKVKKGRRYILEERKRKETELLYTKALNK